VTETCEPLKDYEVFNPVSNVQVDPHLVNITNGDSNAIAYITNTLDSTIVNPLNLNLKMAFSDLSINLKKDF
jgi:hypothetical protein